jgi:anti-sigma B factor antagonist
MQIDTEVLANNVLKIKLTGRMDYQGVQEIQSSFTALTDTGSQPILVDMSEVSFLVSWGLRALLSAAKSSAKNGGTMVLFQPHPVAKEVLQVSGVSHLIPIVDELEEAFVALKIN